MLLADLVACTGEVAATSSRSAKIEALAGLLRDAAGPEAGVVAGLIAGDPRQGRIGVGWATVAALRTQPAAEADTIAAVRSFLPGAAGSIGSEP